MNKLFYFLFSRLMAILRYQDTPRWSPAGLGTFIVSFEDEITYKPDGEGPNNSQKWELLNHNLSSYQDLNSSIDFKDDDYDNDKAILNSENCTGQAAQGFPNFSHSRASGNPCVPVSMDASFSTVFTRRGLGVGNAGLFDFVKTLPAFAERGIHAWQVPEAFPAAVKI